MPQHPTGLALTAQPLIEAGLLFDDEGVSIRDHRGLVRGPLGLGRGPLGLGRGALGLGRAARRLRGGGGASCPGSHALVVQRCCVWISKRLPDEDGAEDCQMLHHLIWQSLADPHAAALHHECN